MKLIETKKAVGHVLCHDITQIIPGEYKGPVFRKGHVISEEDINVLLSVGKEHLYVWEKNENMLHEDEAACILRDICLGEYMTATEPKEGKIEIIANVDGVFKINRESLINVNSLGEMMIATIHGDFFVHAKDKLAATRIIPLVIEKEKMEAAKRVAGDKPILKLLPITQKKVGIVTTGSEVFKGRIKDAFGPAIMGKLKYYDTKVMGQVILDDNMESITNSILDFIKKGADMVLCTGGMSVDPDDKTPGAIKATGANVISYGAPVLPGAMFALAYYNYNGKTVPILGLPGCVMYAKRTIFDLVLPRVLAGDIITKADIARLGEGGLCRNCEVCVFPNCGFGK